MNRAPEAPTDGRKRRRLRRRPARFVAFVLLLVLVLLLLGFKLWEVGLSILVYVYVSWCLKS